jgi:signal transduction histidine kinase
MVRIHVADTGRGIPAAKQREIFEPFVQVDRHLTPDGDQGIGLGLAISRELARAMNGDLTVESEEGEGARFTVVLKAN